MRINRFFTDIGYCSRRQADRLIAAGRVRINEKKAVLGDQVQESDEVFVDNVRLQYTPPKVYIIYHKPVGITCTTDKDIRGNIIDAIKHPLRIFPVGRLDKDSTGLIILTNDGDIVNRILRAENSHDKEYIVQVERPYDQGFLEKIASGVDIGDHLTLPCRVTSVDQRSFKIILTEGKNRQIRRMCEALGFTVQKLHRVRIMNLLIGDLKVGEWRDIAPPLLKELFAKIEKT